MRILFWNLNSKQLRREVHALAIDHMVDLLVLAEDCVPSTIRLSDLNKKDARFFITPSVCERISIFSAFSDSFIRARRESKYYSLREIRLPAHEPFLLMALHWKSLMWRSPQSQTSAIIELARVVRQEEENHGHRRTLIAGDFNVDPFNDGMMTANGMHAVMSRSVAMRQDREVSPFGRFPFFYNPMWSLYGDESTGPPGTYYRSSSEESCQFWHIFDQILVRPDLVPSLPKKSVSVLTKAGLTELISESGVPNQSDHLPLLFEFKPPMITRN